MNESIILNQMNLESLREMMRDTFREELKNIQPKEEIKYRTRKETSKLLHVSLPTLNEYEKHGVITGRRFGRRVLFSEADIMLAVKAIPNLRYNREVRRSK